MMWTVLFAAEQATRRLLGWLREVPGLLASLLTAAWVLLPEPVPPPPAYDENADARTIILRSPLELVRPYAADVPVRWE